jgi:hypothetical protein
MGSNKDFNGIWTRVCVRQYSRERAGAQRLLEDASINTSRQIDVTLFMDIISTHLKHLYISTAC